MGILIGIILFVAMLACCGRPATAAAELIPLRDIKPSLFDCLSLGSLFLAHLALAIWLAWGLDAHPANAGMLVLAVKG